MIETASDTHANAPATGADQRMGTNEALRARYERVLERVGEAARKAGRRPEDIITIAVSKYADIEDVRALIELGHRDFGESRVPQLVQRASMIQEQIERRLTLPESAGAAGREAPAHAGPVETGVGTVAGTNSSGVRWHMIGHLQRNKAKKCVEHARLIQTVDSLRLVEELHQIGMKKELVIDVLVQVNCSGESQKYGCAVGAAHHLAEQVESFVQLRVRGLMCMAPLIETPEDESRARRAFDRCREIFDDLRRANVGEGSCNILSMGMSGDFERAIEHGSNMIRVGSSIFGEHHPSDDSEEPASA